MKRGLIISFVFMYLFFGLSLTVGIPYDEFDSGLKSGLVSYYKLDETSGTIATDIHGLNDGTITNGVTINQSGKIDKSYGLDGTNGHIRLSDDVTLDFGTGDFSISMWVNTTYSGSSPKNMYGTNWGANKALEVRMVSGKVEFLTVNADTMSITTSNSLLNDSNWHHIVAVRDTSLGKLRIYFDGVEEANSIDNGNNVDTSVDTALGGLIGTSTFSTARAFPGDLDEVGIWNRSLSDSEIVELYNVSLDIEILEIIPIQVIENVDLVLGKTTLVRSVLKNPSTFISKNVNVSLYFDGNYQKSNITETIGPGETKNVDLWFIPSSAGIGKEIKIEVEEI